MRKIKPLRRLYFQFGHLAEPKLDAYQIYEALSEAGLIEAVGFRNDEVSHYREAVRERMPADSFLSLVRSILEDYCSRLDAEGASDAKLLEQEQQGRDSLVINAINKGDL